MRCNFRFLLVHGVVWDWVHLARWPLIGLLYQPRMIGDECQWNGSWQGKPKYYVKPCPSATLSTTNATSPDLGSNRACRGGKPTTNRLSYCKTFRGIYMAFRRSRSAENPGKYRILKGKYYTAGLLSWPQYLMTFWGNKYSFPKLKWPGSKQTVSTRVYCHFQPWKQS
jgi:hypothetical protein